MNLELLNDVIDRSKLTRTAIAESLGLSRQGLLNKTTGTREFKGSEIKRLIQILELDEQQQNAIFFADDVD